MKKSLPFPRMCPTCCKKTVQPTEIRHVAEIKYESKTYSVKLDALKVGKCSSCDKVYFDAETDEQIDVAFRREAKLLTADQIRAGRKRLDLTQDDLARALDVAKATISRWEKRRLIQSRAMDKILRAYFHSESVRRLLALIDSDPSIGVACDDASPTLVAIADPLPVYDAGLTPMAPVNRVAAQLQELDGGFNAYLSQIKQRGSFLTL